jgi:glucosamine--fructose-6-phosphate aminotransferase (isomerizing)
MCGIVALIGSREAAPQLLDGLRQLEYRGYDSAGIATVAPDASGGSLHCLKAEGKLVNLTARYEQSGAPGLCGIGHTRWATHGKPEERNAHPHLDGSGRLAVVQNGIIENYRSLREELQASGVGISAGLAPPPAPTVKTATTHNTIKVPASTQVAFSIKSVDRAAPNSCCA